MEDTIANWLLLVAFGVGIVIFLILMFYTNVGEMIGISIPPLFGG
jgi:hypothetical protein